jgi:hypothetical protein
VDERTLYQALPELWLKRMSGEIAWEKQREIMRAIVRYARVAVASANSCGKTFIAARIAVWFLCMYARSIVLITAPTDRQVLEVLWREVRAFKVKAEAHGNPIGGRLLLTGKWEFAEDHFAIGFSTSDSDPARFQGFHSPHVLVIADEAAGISEQIFEGITAVLKGAHSRLLAIGNPTALDGWFYDAFKSEGWYSTHISAFDTPNLKEGGIVVPGLVTAADIEQARIDYGEGSSLYQARVLGQFPNRLDDTMIPIRSVEEAGERQPPLVGEVVVGADIARGGNDSTVFVARCGMNAFAAVEYRGIDTMESTARLAAFCREVKAKRAQIDVVGLGAGVVDRLAELMPELDIVEMNAGKKARDEEHYANAAAQWYAGLAEMLRDQRARGEVFKRRRVIGDLTSRKRRMRSDGRYELEPKHEAQRRGARSPDWGDAIAMCFAPRPNAGPDVEALFKAHLNGFGQRQYGQPTPMKYVLNRQTRTIELTPSAKIPPATDLAGNSNPVMESYKRTGIRLQNLKEEAERSRSPEHASLNLRECPKCGQVPVVGDPALYVGGVLTFHQNCRRPTGRS